MADYTVRLLDCDGLNDLVTFFYIGKCQKY